MLLKNKVAVIHGRGGCVRRQLEQVRIEIEHDLANTIVFITERSYCTERGEVPDDGWF